MQVFSGRPHSACGRKLLSCPKAGCCCLLLFLILFFLNVFLLILVVLFLPFLVGHGFGGESIFLWPCLHCSFQLGEEKAHEDPCYGE